MRLGLAGGRAGAGTQARSGNRWLQRLFRTLLPLPWRTSRRDTMWIKDMAAGMGLLIFIVSSFALTSGAHAMLTSV